MTQHVQFVKSQGLGNDFVLIDAISQRIDIDRLRTQAESLCDRHFGIGADGIILALPSDTSDIQMRVINADGTEPEMCGNGLRCFAKWVREEGLIDKDMFSVQTGAGVRIPALLDATGNEQMIEVGMGEPELNPENIPTRLQPGAEDERVISQPIHIEGEVFNITTVSMGNPHAVIFVDDLTQIDIAHLGPLLANHSAFPKGVNVEFVQVLSRTEAVMIVWERGAGETLACGTGACAVLVAGVLESRLDRSATIQLPGGPLGIVWQESDNKIIMTGPAKTVYRGQFEL